MGTLKPQLLSSYQKPPRCWIRFAHRRKPQGCQSRSWSWPDSPLEGTGFEPSVPPFRSGVPAPTAGAVRRGLFARGNRIRTIGPALPKRSLGCCRRGRRTDKLDGAIKHRSSRETTMVGRGASLHGRLFLGGTDGSNPVPSSAESANYQFRSRQAASVGMSLDNNAPIYSRMAWPMISAGKRYPPQRARAGVVIPPDYLPRYVRASVANVRQVDGASRRTFYRLCSITSRRVSFEQAERFKAGRASWKASATCSRRSGPPPAIRALHSQLFFDAGTTAWWRSRQTVAFVRNTAKWGTAIRPQLRPTFRRRHRPKLRCVRGNGELAMPEGGVLMLWRCYWTGRRARPSASLGAETDASACYLAAAANGCAAAAGRFSLRNPRTCRSAIWICLGFAFHGYRVTWAFGAR